MTQNYWIPLCGSYPTPKGKERMCDVIQDQLCLTNSIYQTSIPLKKSWSSKDFPNSQGFYSLIYC